MKDYLKPQCEVMLMECDDTILQASEILPEGTFSIDETTTVSGTLGGWSRHFDAYDDL